MQGIWLEDQKLSLKTDIPVPVPSEGEVLIKLIQAGICNTDLELCRGYYPYTGVLGHEFVGMVEEGPDELKGKRVCGSINAACGDCHFCNRKIPSHCEKRTVLGIVNRNGCFANYLCLPKENLYPLPDELPTDAATFVEPLAAALEIQQQITIKPEDRVVVIGDGKLGQLVAQATALTGCQLLAVGRHDEKLANLRDVGIKTGKVEDIENGTFDVAVECTGNTEGFASALAALRPRGTLVLKSTYAGKLTLDASAIVVNEITLVGSRCGPFQPAIDLLAQGKVKVEPLIQGRYPLEKGIEAFEHARKKGTMKILLEA